MSDRRRRLRDLFFASSHSFGSRILSPLDFLGQGVIGMFGPAVLVFRRDQLLQFAEERDEWRRPTRLVLVEILPRFGWQFVSVTDVCQVSDPDIPRLAGVDGH